MYAFTFCRLEAYCGPHGWGARSHRGQQLLVFVAIVSEAGLALLGAGVAGLEPRPSTAAAAGWRSSLVHADSERHQGHGRHRSQPCSQVPRPGARAAPARAALGFMNDAFPPQFDFNRVPHPRAGLGQLLQLPRFTSNEIEVRQQAGTPGAGLQMRCLLRCPAASNTSGKIS